MKECGCGTAESLYKQIKALSIAAKIASSKDSSLDDVYDAIEICMHLNKGGSEMSELYDAVLSLAAKTRIDERSINNTKEESCKVYFIKRSDGLIKIGYTHNLKERLSQLKRQYRCGMEVIATLVGGREKEKRLHSKFSHCRVFGEWFSPSNELMIHISKLQPSLQLI